MHWGWYWNIKKKHTRRKTCSSKTVIDSFKILQHENYVGFKIPQFEILAVRFDDHLKITFRKRKEHSYSVPIDKRPCNYGGFRYFFRCPLCDTRMRFLYFGEQSLFLCRKCLNLSYDTQLMRPTTRESHNSRKIEKFLESKGGSLYTKPKGMHQKRYEKLVALHTYFEAKWRAEGNKELRLWYGPRIEPELDKYFDYVPEKP
jgi:hypothetical protein